MDFSSVKSACVACPSFPSYERRWEIVQTRLISDAVTPVMMLKSCGCTLETVIYVYPSIIKYVYPSIILCPIDFCVTVNSPVWMMLVCGNQQCSRWRVIFFFFSSSSRTFLKILIHLVFIEGHSFTFIYCCQIHTINTVSEAIYNMCCYLSDQ